MDFSSPFLVRVRSLGRRLGILKPLQRIFRWRRAAAYEESFEKALLSRIMPGDIVWDVGANIGHYTKKFADIVGASGHVVAFEPSPRTFAKLSAAMSHSHNITVANVALSNLEGHVDFYVGSDDCNPTDGLSAASIESTSKVLQVITTTGDRYIAENAALAPTSIKIDVEGFESDVLSGLAGHLTSDKLKTLFIEFHFEVLAARGLVNEPRGITEMLRKNGFAIWWTDPSHMCAQR
jgi:FkbM family methyltransferase